MKKVLSLVIALCMAFMAVISSSKSGVLADTSTVNLDDLLVSDSANWHSDNIWHPTTVTWDSGTMSATPNNAGVETLISYNTKYTDETFNITAKVENQAQWHFIVLRSQSLTGTVFEGTKYFVYFAGTTAYLGRTVNGAFTDLGGVSLGGSVTYSADTTYSISAVNEANRVLITVKVNDLTAVTLEDTTAGRITLDGYFGIGLYEGSANAKITIGKIVAPVYPEINLDDKLLSDSANWYSGSIWHPTTVSWESGTMTAAPSTSVNNPDKASVSTQIVYNTKYTNESLKLNAKLENQAGWHAIVLRSQDLTGGIFQGTKYFIYFSGTSVFLGRVIAGVFTDLGGVGLGTSVNYSANTLYRVSAVNEATRVLFKVSVNNSLDVTLQDTTAERLVNEGYFGIGLSEGSVNAKLTIGTKIAITNLDRVMNDQASFTATPSDIPNSLNFSTGYVNMQAGAGLENTVAYTKTQFGDSNLQFTAKTTIDSGWVGFVVRAKSSAIGAYYDTNECYFFGVSNSSVTLYRQNLGKPLEFLSSASCTEFSDGLEHKVNIITKNLDNNVVIKFYVDDVEKLLFNDTSADRIVSAGYFTNFIFGTNTVTLGNGTIIKGDIIVNGNIDLSDLAAAKSHLLHISTLTPAQIGVGDIQSKGYMSISDLLTIKKHILGIALIG